MTTIFLGRLLGLYLVAVAVAMIVDRRRTLATLDAMMADPAWMLFSGMVATAIGLAIVLAHGTPRGGTLAVLVALVGWTALAKGLALLLVPAERWTRLYAALGFSRRFHLWLAAVLALGLWMTALAFAA